MTILFIDIARSKIYQDLLSFAAIVTALSSAPVERLYQCWQCVPSHQRHRLAEFTVLLESDREHRRYRLLVANMYPPIIPLMPLLVKSE